MLRTVSLVLLSMMLLAISATPALAENADNEVSVGVLGVNFMDLPSETELILTPATTDPAARLIGAADQPGALVMSHNGADGLRITVTAAADLLNLPNDISLVVSLADLAPQSCVDHGRSLTDMAFPAPLQPGGGYSDLLWSAEATSEATQSGVYAWDIIITSTDM